MNPLNRLMTEAEVSLSAAGRRIVENVTAPLRNKAHDIVSEAVGTVAATARNLLLKAVAGLFAAVMLIVAICYALSAAYQKLADLLGPIDATLVMAGAFLLLAVIGIAAAILVPTVPKKKPEAAPDADRLGGERVMSEPAEPLPQDAPVTAADDGTTNAEPTETDHALRSGLDAIVVALGEAGFRREQAGLRAGLVLARQLRPMQVVSLALLGGFLAGARLAADGRRPPP